jgi:methylphosphotriester-DNA--protein-cysteine methyltransferase
VRSADIVAPTRAPHVSSNAFRRVAWRVAAAAHLSPDRLRHLFKEQVGCTISHYARTAAVWRALSQWAHGEPLTAVAHDVGFHDYAHSHHAFCEMFGFPPSMLKGRGLRGGVKLIRGG